MVVFRYLPQPQSSNRFGYEPSAELMGRLTDVRREMLVDLNHPDPQPPVRNPTQPDTPVLEPEGCEGHGRCFAI